jgi:hypothetical protein
MIKGLVLTLVLLLLLSVGVAMLTQTQIRRNRADQARWLAIREIAAAYIDYCHEKKKPPLGLADLRLYADRYPLGFETVGAGGWVINWGTELSDNPRGNTDREIGHESTLPQAAGVVMLGDGSFTSMMPEDYRQWLDETVTLRQIWTMYHAFWTHQRKAPLSLADLEQYGADSPRGLAAVKNGSWVVCWGTAESSDPKENFDRLIAFECKAHSDGGWVLTADGSGRFRDFSNGQEAPEIARQIGDLWRRYYKEHGKPPATVNDLRPYADNLPKGFQALAGHTWLVRWGRNIKPAATESASQVLAFERAVRMANGAKEGWVLMGDSTIRLMTAGQLDDAVAKSP